MKRIISFLFSIVAFLLASPLFAQAQKAPEKGSGHVGITPIYNTENKSLLWRITGNGLTKPSFMFGTIHLISKADYFWTTKMQQSLTQSEQVCFEMDLSDPTVMMQAAAGFIDNSGKKLKDYFTPAQYLLLKNYLRDSAKMDIAMFESMKPIALETVLATAGVRNQDAVSYEEEIMAEAKKQGKKILGLESAQEQLDVLETLPADSVVNQIIAELQNNGPDTTNAQLIKAYKTQDLPKLFELITTSNDMDEEMGPFLDDRNKKWIPLMAGKMHASSIFFAVGAGHLWGDNGVINLLRKQGYTVQPEK